MSSKLIPRTTPPLSYRLARWKEQRLLTLVGWLTAIAALLVAGFLAGSIL